MFSIENRITMVDILDAITKAEESISEEYNYGYPYCLTGLRNFIDKNDPSRKEVIDVLFSAVESGLFFLKKDYYYFGTNLQYCIKTLYAFYVLKFLLKDESWIIKDF